MDLRGKKVVLTGASGGIGSAMAVALASAGAELLLVGRDEPHLATLADKVGGSHQLLVADIATDRGRDALHRYCAEKWGAVDLLINNAGTSAFGLFTEQSEALVGKQIEINLLVPILLCQKMLPRLLESPAGAIVNVGSAFGSIGYPGFAVYSASKFGLRGFTEALRRELADTSVKVFYLAPRATDTGLNSDQVKALNKELGTSVDAPEVVAQALLKQLQKERLRVFIGQPEGLFTRLNGLFPNIVDAALIKQLPVIRRFAKSQSSG